MFSITFPSINSFLPYFVHFLKNFYLYSSGWSATNYLCFLNRIRYLLKNSVLNSGAGEKRRDCELIASALQVRLCGSDILSVFLLTLRQSFSVWWSRDGCLVHLLTYSVASLRQRWGSGLLRKAAGSSSQVPHLLSCLIYWWGLCRTLPVRFIFQHLVILIKSSLKLLGGWDVWL